jgi:CrcB protein
MTHSKPDRWPVDPDVTAQDASRPRLDVLLLAAVVAGGFCGGLVRYEVTDQWSTRPGQFPWPIFVVNTVGAFMLGAVVIAVLDVLAESRYLRPLVGAGFCGALTTFSSVVVAVDQLLRHGHVVIGLSYLFGSLVAGIVAAGMGAALGRKVPPTAARRRLHKATT